MPLRRIAAVPVSRNLDFHLPELGLHGLVRVTVAVVGRRLGCLRALAALTPKFLVQFHLEFLKAGRR